MALADQEVEQRACGPHPIGGRLAACVGERLGSRRVWLRLGLRSRLRLGCGRLGGPGVDLERRVLAAVSIIAARALATILAGGLALGGAAIALAALRPAVVAAVGARGGAGRRGRAAATKLALQPASGIVS